MLSAAVVRVLAISGYNNIAPIKWNFIRPPLGGHPGWSIASHARTCLALPGVRFHLSPNARKTLRTVSLVYESVFTCKRDVQNQVEAKLSCQQQCFVYSTDLWLHVFKNYIFLIENYLREKNMDAESEFLHKDCAKLSVQDGDHCGVFRIFMLLSGVLWVKIHITLRRLCNTACPGREKLFCVEIKSEVCICSEMWWQLRQLVWTSDDRSRMRVPLHRYGM